MKVTAPAVTNRRRRFREQRLANFRDQLKSGRLLKKACLRAVGQNINVAPGHENAILLGPPGLGKTHLTMLLASAATESGRRVYYGTLIKLMESLNIEIANGEVSATKENTNADVRFNTLIYATWGCPAGY